MRAPCGPSLAPSLSWLSQFRRARSELVAGERLLRAGLPRELQAANDSPRRACLASRPTPSHLTGIADSSIKCSPRWLLQPKPRLCLHGSVRARLFPQCVSLSRASAPACYAGTWPAPPRARSGATAVGEFSRCTEEPSAE